jgi:alpha-D-ribose 1-methylphosphonate 5-triphosphate synthase subunit PhnG
MLICEIVLEFVALILNDFSQEQLLSIVTHAPADAVKDFVENLLPTLGEITVLENRTGLVMLPYTDSVQGTHFHLGEVLVSEAHIRMENGGKGYALCTGRDLVQALAIALLDACVRAGLHTEAIAGFVQQQQVIQHEQDQQLLRQVEATRVEMETF